MQGNGLERIDAPSPAVSAALPDTVLVELLAPVADVIRTAGPDPQHRHTRMYAQLELTVQLSQ